MPYNDYMGFLALSKRPKSMLTLAGTQSIMDTELRRATPPFQKIFERGE